MVTILIYVHIIIYLGFMAYFAIFDKFSMSLLEFIGDIYIIGISILFYRGSKLAGTIILLSYVPLILAIILYPLHYLNLLDMLGGSMYLIIPIVTIIIGVITVNRLGLSRYILLFMNHQSNKRSKRYNFIEKMLLILFTSLFIILGEIYSL